MSFEPEPGRLDPPSVNGGRVVELVSVVDEPRPNPGADAGLAVSVNSVIVEPKTHYIVVEWCSVEYDTLLYD